MHLKKGEEGAGDKCSFESTGKGHQAQKKVPKTMTVLVPPEEGETTREGHMKTGKVATGD